MHWDTDPQTAGNPWFRSTENALVFKSSMNIHIHKFWWLYPSTICIHRCICLLLLLLFLLLYSSIFLLQVQRSSPNCALWNDLDSHATKVPFYKTRNMKSDNPKHLTYLTLTKQRNTLNKHFSALHSRPQVFPRQELAKLAANAKARSNAEATPEAEPTPQATQATPQATSLGWEW